MESFFGIGILELFFIAILALIIMGPERLPGVMREGANYIRKLRQMGNELTSQFSDELNALDELNPKRIFNEMTDPNRPDPNDKTKPAAKTPTPTKPAAKPASPAPAKTAATKPAPAKPATTQPATTAASASAASAVVADAAQQSAAQAAPSDNTILPPAVEKPASTAATQINDPSSLPSANGVAEVSVAESMPAHVESQA